MYFRESENMAIEMTLNQGRLVQDYCLNLLHEIAVSVCCLSLQRENATLALNP